MSNEKREECAGCGYSLGSFNRYSDELCQFCASSSYLYSEYKSLHEPSNKEVVREVAKMFNCFLEMVKKRPGF